MRELARDCLQEVRRSVWDLRAGPLEGSTLAQALQRETDSLASQKEIQATFAVSGEEKVAYSGVEAAILRICQESLTNVARHSEATQVEVTLTYEDSGGRFEVHDNGSGFDPETGYLYVSSRRQYIVVGMRPVENPEVRGYDYEHKFFQVGIGGLPVVKPPYGTLTAYDMNRGEIAWQTPHGNGPRERGKFKDLGLPALGNPNAAGVLITRTLLFVGDRGDPSEPSFVRAYDKSSGKTLWEHELPGRHHNAAPMTYIADGLQFLVIGVGGAAEPARLVAFRLA